MSTIDSENRSAQVKNASQANNIPAEGYVKTMDGGDLHYLDWGEGGPQMHLLHANGFCAGTYAPLINQLKDQFHIIASDARGHGDTSALPKLPIRHWRIFAEDLKQVIDRVMAPPIIGAGHSLGAVSTYMAAALYPYLFSAIILMDPVMLPPKLLWSVSLLKFFGLGGRIPLAKGARRRRKVFAGKKQALERFTSGHGIFKRWSPEFIEAYLECGFLEKDEHTAILKCDPELEAQIFETVPTDVWRYASRIHCPVLVIRGKHTDAFPESSAMRFKKMVSDCRIETIARSGHFVPMEQPQICAELISTFALKHANES